LTEQIVSSPTGSKKPRFFYGYIVALASFLVMAIMWGTIQSFGIFLKPMSAEFGWTRAMTSGSFSLFLLVLGFLFMVAGRLNDRFGPRIITTVCGVFLGLGFLLMSQVSALWQLYLLYGVMVAIGTSGGFVPLASTVTRWFVKRRGLMTGIVLSGVSVGAMVVPPMSSWLISSYGWQTSYLVLGIINLVLIILAAQFLKRDPSEIGQLPDGEGEVKTESLVPEAKGFSPQEAMRTRQFWMLCLMYLCWGLIQNTIMVHIMPHATDLGIVPIVAANILVIIGGVGIVFRIGIGSVADRTGTRPALIVSFILLSIALFWLQLAQELWMFHLFAILFGVGFGGLATLLSPTVAELFGMRAHGAILEMATAAWAIGGAVGSLLAGHIFDVTGSYYLAFLVLGALSVTGLVLTLSLKPAEGKS